MSYIPEEELKKGNVEFLYTLLNYPYDTDNLINRIRSSKDIDEILANSLYKLKHLFPCFLYKIIYDNPKYENIAYTLYKDNFKIENFDISIVFNLMNKTRYGPILVKHNLDILFTKDRGYISTLIHTMLINGGYDKELKNISLHDDLSIRCLFMEILIKGFPDRIKDYYDDITKYFTSYTYQEGEQLTFLPTLMNVKDICNLYITMLDQTSPYAAKTKEFILTHYDKNYLASMLLNQINNVPDYIKQMEFEKDADRIFETTIDYKIQLLTNYSKYIKDEYINALANHLRYFKDEKGNYKYIIDHIFSHGLGNKLEKYIDKYLSLSTCDDYRFLSSGSTSSSYKIGDYVFKLSTTKWSYEDIIVPEIYLIIKDLEEEYIRNDKGIILAGLEVQQYLEHDGENVDYKSISNWFKDLDDLGYVFTDRLVHGECGCNARVLNDYHDANCHNPEALPDWFKEQPLVLVDRDRVYCKGKNIKQQVSSAY